MTHLKKIKLLTVLAIFLFSLIILTLRINYGLIGYIGIGITILLSVVAILNLSELSKVLDLNLLKLFQPFYIAIYTISLMFAQSNDHLINFLNIIALAIINILVFKDPVFASYLRKFSIKICAVFCLLFLSLCLSILVEVSGESSSKIINIVITKGCYFCTLIIFALIGNYNTNLNYIKQLETRRYLIIKICAFIVIAGKFLLSFGYLSHSFIFEILYIVAIVNLILSFRQQKEYFILICLILIAASLLPGKFVVSFTDQTLIAFITCLFFLKSPVLIHLNSEFGNIIVGLKYKTKTKFILNNGIIHCVEPLNYQGGPCIHPYYRNANGQGALISVLSQYDNKDASIAVLGMGGGMVASLVNQHQQLTFFEINPHMQDIAINSGIFNYIRFSPGKVNIRIGHARKELEKVKQKFDLLIIDAYIGKKVVSEFLTLEAFQLYLKRLKSDGAIAVHLTSGYKNNEEILASICKEMQLSALINYKAMSNLDIKQSLFKERKRRSNGHLPFVQKITKFLGEEEDYPQKDYIVWALVARDRSSFGEIANDARWHELRHNSNILPVTDKQIKFFQEEETIVTQNIE